jgi:hypothetical protein
VLIKLTKLASQASRAKEKCDGLTLTKQSWKKSRIMEAPIRGSAATAGAITDRTIASTFGHVLA